MVKGKWGFEEGQLVKSIVQSSKGILQDICAVLGSPGSGREDS
jgi:hypothetical protein